MSVRMALGIAYHGTQFHGWQSQPSLPNVQDTLEKAITAFSTHTCPVICAGRTDAGVHALNQVIHFDSPVVRENFSWVKGVNAFLPPSVRVIWARQVSDQFHARFDAIERSYIYRLRNEPIRMPMFVGVTGWEFRPLALEPMQEAARLLLGEHDFSCFRASECQAKSPVRIMYQLDICQHGIEFVFHLRANAFLHHMVRNIVGSLIYVGQGKHSPNWMLTLLESRHRALAAPTFMPDGLYLSDVVYPEWRASEQSIQLFRKKA